MIHRYQRYFQKIVQQPPQVTLRKVQRRLRAQVKHSWERERARWLSTHLSDQAFTRALDARYVDGDAFLTHMTTRTTPHFFFAAGDQPVLVALLRTHLPQQEELIIAAADQSCAHIFDLLGSGPTPLGEPIDWHRDFKSGHRWNPRQYFAEIRSAPFPGGYDLKVPWELSRCQHFVWLGQAYWLTDDERYATEFVAQVRDWIEHNPPQLGVNWGCAMDVAIRAVNWLWGYYFFQHSATLTAEFQRMFFKSLLSHGRHIMANLEWSETLTSNHYLSDVVGLVYLGLLLPEFKEAATWRDYGLQALEAEMMKQVYDDGVDFEASISYHRLALELFLSPTLLAQRNGHQFSPAYCQRLEAMCEFIMAVTKPDGTAPFFGDNDNGRLHRLKIWPQPEREWADYRYLLAIGAILFERADFVHAADDQWEEALWLWGAQAARGKEHLTQTNGSPAISSAFPDGGIYVMRQDDHYLAVDAGANGQKGNGGHAHNDTLSFELYTQQQAWIVDPGAYLYTGDFAARNLFRSTAYHNTICVDGQEQHPFAVDSLFRLAHDSWPVVHAWHTTPAYDLLDVSDASYMRLAHPVTHRRRIYFDKARGVWLVHDKLQGSNVAQDAPHDLLWSWHFAPGLTLQCEDRGITALAPQGSALRLCFLTDDPPSSYLVEEGWVSNGYGIRTSAPILRYQRRQCLLPQQLTVVFLPLAHLSTPADSAQVAAQVYQEFLAARPNDRETAMPATVTMAEGRG